MNGVTPNVTTVECQLQQPGHIEADDAGKTVVGPVHPTAVRAAIRNPRLTPLETEEMPCSQGSRKTSESRRNGRRRAVFV